MNWTLFLAIWGSVLSTVLAVIKILEYRKDRGDIKVTVRGGYNVAPPTTIYGDKKYVLIVATNKGRRPVTIKGVALRLPRNNQEKLSFLLCPDAIKNVELTEGRDHQYLIPEEDLMKKYDLPKEKYVACAWDATGKYYWSHNFLKRLFKLGRIK